MSYVQYGCGHDAPDTWINYDSSPTLRLERAPVIGKFLKKNENRFPPCVRHGDIVRGLPLPAEQADAIYTSHTLEHLSLIELRTALKNTFTLLKPGGVFRCVVPDLAFYIDNYLKDDSPVAAHTFLQETMLGIVNRPKGIYEWLKEILGGSSHYWMWDYASLEYELSKAGFVSIRRAKFGDSQVARFADVENPERWHNCLGIESHRPQIADS
ncbi:MAG: hypothetical protein SynsKO_39350 [Synoicihabitans sp.]